MSLLDDILRAKLREVTQGPEVRPSACQAPEARVLDWEREVAVREMRDFLVRHPNLRLGGAGGSSGDPVTTPLRPPVVTLEESRGPGSMGRTLRATVEICHNTLEYYRHQGPRDIMIQDMARQLTHLLLAHDAP